VQGGEGLRGRGRKLPAPHPSSQSRQAAGPFGRPSKRGNAIAGGRVSRSSCLPGPRRFPPYATRESWFILQNRFYIFKMPFQISMEEAELLEKLVMEEANKNNKQAPVPAIVNNNGSSSERVRELLSQGMMMLNISSINLGTPSSSAQGIFLQNLCALR